MILNENDLLNNIQSVSNFFSENQIKLTDNPGLYAFWWIDDKEKLFNSNLNIVLKGPAGKPLKIKFEDWWPKDLVYPCLYVGKTTNIKNRFSQHIKRGSYKRLHLIPDSGEKQKAVTTTCQLRYGIEHIFKTSEEPLNIILNSVGFSYSTNNGSNGFVDRFYMEDRLIGTWKPWFNIDSER